MRRTIFALVAMMIVAAFPAAHANHYILPCDDDCARSATWTPTGNLNFARSWHTATLLLDVRVLVAGGGGAGILNGTELFSPATPTWTLAAPMNVPRLGHTATLPSDGAV